MNSKYLTKAGIIAALYVILIALEIPFGMMAFGPIQFRIAEALVLLPLVESASIPGVFIGCLLGNILLSFSGTGLIDIIGGSLVTLISAYLTSKVSNINIKIPKNILGMLPPVILNAFIVSIWISALYNVPYVATVIGIGLGELLAVGIFGNIVLYAYKRI
ncbi:MAG: QueT transporter family protein [Firmicutes bacterium]|nr:QueT transporter family protein [Bacillota bacterium]